MSSSKTYDKYKNVKHELFDQIPAHWELFKASHLFDNIGSGTTPKSDKQEYYENGDVSWLTTGDLNDNNLTSCDGKITRKALEEHSALKEYPEGSIAIAMYGATIGKTAILQFRTTTNQACCVFSASSKIHNKYFHYQLLSLKPYILSLAVGGGQPNINQEILRSLKITVPKNKEQLFIANFLDRETAKIDSLIAEQESLIELLKEKRQALISHAVTKGLNPDAQMKDSGVEWLGEVPEHWEETNIKRISKIYGRIGFRGYTVDDIVDEGDGAIALAPGNLEEKGFSLEKKTYISWKKYEESPEIMIKQGDVLLVKTGSTFGKCCYVDRLNEAATLNPQMVVFKEIIPENEFFYYQLRSAYVQAVIQNMNKGSALPTVTQEAIGSIKLFVPPINEQQSILEQLSKTLIGNEELLDNSRKAISLLSERRSALISAGVTGQIDVRNLSPEEATS